jgi:hypothetical protein
MGLAYWSPSIGSARPRLVPRFLWENRISASVRHEILRIWRVSFRARRTAWLRRISLHTTRRTIAAKSSLPVQVDGTSAASSSSSSFPSLYSASLADPTNGNSRARVIKRRCFNDGDASKFATAAKIKPPHARYSLRNFGSEHHWRRYDHCGNHGRFRARNVV